MVILALSHAPGTRVLCERSLEASLPAPVRMSYLTASTKKEPALGASRMRGNLQLESLAFCFSTSLLWGFRRLDLGAIQYIHGSRFKSKLVQVTPFPRTLRVITTYTHLECGESRRGV